MDGFYFCGPRYLKNIEKKYPYLINKIYEIGRPVPNKYFETKTKIVTPIFKNKLITFFACSRAVEEKGVHLIIKALSNLRDKNGAEIANFIYCGDGNFLEDLKSLAKKII